MALQPYEILLRWKDDGTFSGGHTIRRDDVTGRLSDTMPIGKDTKFPWADIAKEINTALLPANNDLAELQKAHVEVTENLATAEQKAIETAKAIKAAVADQNAEAVLAIIADDTERAKAAAKAKVEAAQSELDALLK